MAASVLSLVDVRLRRLAERFLALQTAIDDGGSRRDLPALEAELERVVRDVARVTTSVPRSDDDGALGAAVMRAVASRQAWRDAQRERGPGTRADDAADTFTLALIELALRLRGRAPRAAAAQR